MCGARRFLARAEAFLFSLLIIESMHLYLEILHGCTAEQNPNQSNERASQLLSLFSPNDISKWK